MALKKQIAPPTVEAYLTRLSQSGFEGTECNYCHFKDKFEHFSVKWKHVQDDLYEFIHVLKCSNCGFKQGWKWQMDHFGTVAHIVP